jgi:hypothetical protein
MADNRVVAVVESLIGGMNAAVPAHAITDTQYARGINVAVRGGFAATRPGWHTLGSGFVDQVVAEATGFQGAGIWSTPSGEFLATVWLGQVYLMLLSTGAVTVIGAYLDASAQVHIIQASQYLCFFDGVGLLVLDWDTGTSTATVKKTSIILETMTDDSWDPQWQGIAFANLIAAYMTANPGVTFAAASAAVLAAQTAPSFPIGTIATFVHNRIHLVSATGALNKRYFLSSDILLPSDPSSVLRWWENMYLNSGGGLGLPEEMGDIRGMGVLRQSASTASGLGALLVFAQSGVAAFNVFEPREGIFDITLSENTTTFVQPKLLSPGWKDKQIAQVLFRGAGTESPWAIATVNGDVFYRSQDGWRTLRQTLQAAQGSLTANAPASAEVKPFIALDSGVAKLDRVSATTGDHRLLMTAGRQADESYAGIIAFDTNTLTTLGTTPLAAFDGLWTGIDVVKILASSTDILAIAKDGRVYKYNSLQHDKKESTVVPIECQVMTKQLSFRTTQGTSSATWRGPVELKFLDIWAKDIEGTLNLAVYYRPDNHPWWTPMGTKTIVVAAGAPAEERRRLRFQPCNTTAMVAAAEGLPMTQGETIQFLVIWTGQMTLRRMYCEAIPVQESPPRLTSDPKSGTISRSADQILQDDFSYEVV